MYIFEYTYMISTNFNNKFLSIWFVIELLEPIYIFHGKSNESPALKSFDDIFHWFVHFEWTWPILTIIICKLNQKKRYEYAKRKKKHSYNKKHYNVYNVMIWIRTMPTPTSHVQIERMIHCVIVYSFFISKIIIIFICFVLLGSAPIVFRLYEHLRFAICADNILINGE